MSRIRLVEGEEPSSPPTGKHYIYVDSADSIAKIKDSSGVVSNLGAIATVFGTNYQSIESLSETTNSTTTPQQKLRLNFTGANPGEKYLVFFGYNWNHDDDKSDFIASITQKNETVKYSHQQEPKDKDGTGPGGSAQKQIAGAHFEVTISDNSDYVEIKFWSEVGGKASTIWNTRMSAWRVS